MDAIELSTYEIMALQSNAESVGDVDMVRYCQLARQGNAEARRIVAAFSAEVVSVMEDSKS